VVLFADHPVPDALPIVSGEILTVLTFVAYYPLNVKRVDSGEVGLLSDVGFDSGRGIGTCGLDLPLRGVCLGNDAISSGRGYKG
jgi:hypothetical protein